MFSSSSLTNDFLESVLIVQSIHSLHSILRKFDKAAGTGPCRN